MNNTITIAGATGNLGGRIAAALTKQGAHVRALVRPGTDDERLAPLRAAGVEIREVDLENVEELTKALEGTNCVISALQGLREVIVDAQSVLLEAAVAAHVPRFIPSDFSVNYNSLQEGDNRNFDLRREFAAILNQAPIQATSIWNGAFANALTFGGPLLDPKTHTVGFWGDADFRVDYTTMDDTAAFTAAAALDNAAPRDLYIASFQISAPELAQVATQVLDAPFETADKGTLDALSAHNRAERATHPEGETNLYASWQLSQYNYSMFKVVTPALDNSRYPQLTWTSVEDVLKPLAK